MTPEQFVYWLQGYMEINEKADETMSPRQVQIIKDHLAKVLDKKTPTYTLSGTGTTTMPGSITNVPYYYENPGQSGTPRTGDFIC
jgi:hypothetical protein